MADTRYRVLLLSPPRSGTGAQSVLLSAVHAVPPRSFWFIEREDAEVVARLSVDAYPAVAVLAYADGARPRLVRFHGSADHRAWFLSGPAARGADDAATDIAFFESGSGRPAESVAA